ncbi:MAG: hypothetical protein IID03_10985 [Candidatus Dadabacteria bacterium]|nr:hypothetical protein [Candidatus Dadabacteria bacterium]
MIIANIRARISSIAAIILIPGVANKNATKPIIVISKPPIPNSANRGTEINESMTAETTLIKSIITPAIAKLNVIKIKEITIRGRELKTLTVVLGSIRFLTIIKNPMSTNTTADKAYDAFLA